MSPISLVGAGAVWRLPATRRLGSITAMRRYIRRAALLLLTSASTACISEAAECHRRAMASLGCCPSCDPNCEVSKNADAKFAVESCLAALGQQQDQSSASEEGAGTTDADDPGETTFRETW